MNIVTPVPTTLAFTTANVNTEAARRDNLLKETIPPSKDADNSASEQGLGSESDRAKSPGQQAAPVTYERPQVQAEAPSASLPQEGNDTEQGNTDNGNRESAGKESAEEKQQQQAQQQEIEQLEQRDQEVRQHEQAHATRGGQYASAPQYDYENGPDGKRYVTDGEVSIDVSEAESPEQTVQKMEQVRAAALAPAEPSAQDLKVASEATRIAAEARQALNQDGETTTDLADPEPANVERSLAQEATEGQSRVGIIQQFYQSAVTPNNTAFTASA
ncbi:putative metalloprotease CJM1_0395 family protein [Alteromonas sp. C1M14]|uniref:putative metalloprotease CJM1_0395 family protein n=1 Tax=Alteromonas sp. C1M14 TaxID=2841567 RepID=UPI001C08AFE4|nr:putative metalloprotease CJM1_0395 family protein [Alteromonas sp. C1M14]MBU2978359.1 hypothetical protein [Alteromonas sp. C1M14]